MNFIDLHSHILPGIDDGSTDLETSHAMIEGLQRLGFTTLCATPHQRDGYYLPSQKQIHDAAQALGDSDTYDLVIGAENMWDSVFRTRVESEDIPGYGQRQVFLLELPTRHKPAMLESTLFSLRTRGWLPVLAHPERYEFLYDNTALLEQLHNSCAMVCDLGAVAGDHGRKRAKYARKWLERGLIHAVASDAHYPSDIEQTEKGINWIRKKLGSQAVEVLLSKNPARVLSGILP